MKSVRLVQIFYPVEETNRTHSKSYVEDLSTMTGRKRCAKVAWLNLSVLPQCEIEKSRFLNGSASTLFACIPCPNFESREFVTAAREKISPSAVSVTGR